MPGTPPIEQFYTSGVQVAVGTDSLASTADLNLFSELAMMRTLARGVPAALLLDSATRQGARALGLDVDYGTIAPGKRARLISVNVPPGGGRCGRISGVGSPPGTDRVDLARSWQIEGSSLCSRALWSRGLVIVRSH